MARCKTRYLMRGAGEGHKKTLELGFGKTRRHQEKRTPPQQDKKRTTQDATKTTRHTHRQQDTQAHT